MRRHPLLCSALLVVAAMGTSLAAEPAAKSLEWKFKKGQELPYTIEQLMAMTGNAGGLKTSSKQELTFKSRLRVLDVKGDEAEVSQTVDRVRTKLDGPFGEKIEFDSAKEETTDNPFVTVLAAMVNAPFTFKMDRRGKQSEFKVPEKITRALESVPGAPLPEFQQMFGQSFLMLPEQEVSEGETWSDSVKVPMPLGTVRYDNTYTYRGTESKGGKEYDKISLKSDFSIEQNDTAVPVEITGHESEGIIYFDSAAGRLVEMKLQLKMTLELQAGAMVLQQTMDTTMTLKLTTGTETKEESAKEEKAGK